MHSCDSLVELPENLGGTFSGFLQPPLAKGQRWPDVTRERHVIADADHRRIVRMTGMRERMPANEPAAEVDAHLLADALRDSARPVR